MLIAPIVQPCQGDPLPKRGTRKQGTFMLLKFTSISGAAGLACAAALSIAPIQAMAAGAYHAPPAPVFRAPPPAPVYIAPRIVTTPAVTVRPNVTTPGVKPTVGTGKPVIARPAVGTTRPPVARRPAAVPPVIITTTTPTAAPVTATPAASAAPVAPAAKCTAKQTEVLARCKKS
jgi:hypothetical protein